MPGRITSRGFRPHTAEPKAPQKPFVKTKNDPSDAIGVGRGRDFHDPVRSDRQEGSGNGFGIREQR